MSDSAMRRPASREISSAMTENQSSGRGKKFVHRMPGAFPGDEAAELGTEAVSSSKESSQRCFRANRRHSAAWCASRCTPNYLSGICADFIKLPDCDRFQTSRSGDLRNLTNVVTRLVWR